MTLFRGIADDLDLQEWLTKYIFPAEAKNVTEDFVRVGTRLGMAEMIRSGTTTYCDMYYFEDAIADETFKAGMRGVLGETVIDFPVADNKTYEAGLAYSEKFIQKWTGNALIVPAIAPHAPYTVSEEHLKPRALFPIVSGARSSSTSRKRNAKLTTASKPKGRHLLTTLAASGSLTTA
jgi:5-methylthioadenosine/S-adenosylhomocysteine deaminase